MIQRCLNPRAQQYRNYGARGIRVCERWLENFENFIQDMGEKPSPQHSLDRIDNHGDYTPENCRWATRKVQARNKRNNHLITAGQETMPISAWAERTGLRKNTIKERLRRGWDPVRAVTEAPKF
jgi:hypothetical protein